MKWLGNNQATRERLERVSGEVLSTFRADDEEVAAVADNDELYRRLQARLTAARTLRGENKTVVAAHQATTRTPSGFRIGFGVRSLAWSLVAAAVILPIILTAPRWLPRLLLNPLRDARQTAAATVPSTTRQPKAAESPAAITINEQVLNASEASQAAPAQHYDRHAAVRRDESDDEIADNFVPLTLDDADASEGSQVVRITLPRSALVQFGLPANPERADEFVKADVLLSDDGLARAIRFIQ